MTNPTTFDIDQKHIEIYTFGTSPESVIYFNAFEHEKELVLEELKDTPTSFCLVVIQNLDWNRDMSPWESGAVIKGGEPFTGGADDYLQILTTKIVPEVEKNFPPFSRRGIAGYSLSGLFALYSIYRTDMFSLIGCFSGSLWFKDFRTFALTREPAALPSYIYFSLGDREAKTRNEILSGVQKITQELFEHYKKANIPTEFHLCAGNHFADVGKRIARGLIRMAENVK